MGFGVVTLCTVTIFLVTVALPLVLSLDYMRLYDDRILVPERHLQKLSPNLIVGKRQKNDRLLYNNRISLPGIPSEKIVNDFKFPQIDCDDDCIKGYPFEITRINIINTRTPGYPSITDGGVGDRNVTIRLESKVGQGLNYNIRVYGKIVSI